MKSGIIGQHNVWCPTAEEMCKSKWIAGNDALKLFMVPVSLQLKSDNPYPGLNVGSFFHRSSCPAVFKDFSQAELLYSLPLCSLWSINTDTFFSSLTPLIFLLLSELQWTFNKLRISHNLILTPLNVTVVWMTHITFVIFQGVILWLI